MSDTFDPDQVAWALDDVSFERMIAQLETADEITFDLETTSLNEFGKDAAVVLASFTLPNYDTWLLPLYHPESPFEADWRERFRRAMKVLWGKFLMAHNGKFDCRWTNRHAKVNLAKWLGWDSQMSSHLLDENRSTKLKDRAPDTFGVERWDDFDLKKENAALQVPLIQLGMYAARDTYWTQRLCNHHREQLFTMPDTDSPTGADEVEDARLGQVQVWTNMPTTRSLTAVECRGIKLDVPWCEERIAAETLIRDSTREILVGSYGMVERFPTRKPSFAPTSIWFREWTQAAVDAGDLKIISMTKGGKPQWNKFALMTNKKNGSEIAGVLLEHRGAVKRLEYLKAWLRQVRDDGAIHASYNAGSLITGRLSSSNPNMQQVTKVLRPAFVPREGFHLADFDYSQIEMRVAAHVADCKPMIEAFKAGDDLHRMLARRMAQDRENAAAKQDRREPREITLAEVTGGERQGGKAGNFGLLFGMGPGGLQKYAEAVYDVVLSRKEAQEAYNAFFEQWQGMREWHAKVIAKVDRDGQVSSPIGRVRRLPGAGGGVSTGYSGRAGINAPVQGFASDMMQMAAASIEGMFPGHDRVQGARIVATVHDSIVVEIRKDRWQEIVEECQRRMTDGILEILWNCFRVKIDVPIVADVKVGTRWGLSDIYGED